MSRSGVRVRLPAPEEVINLLNKEKKTKELLSDIAKLEKKHEDKIAVIIVSALRKSEKTIEESDLIAIWDEAEDKIIDLIYELLERVYRLILEFIKEVYPEAKISKRIDIKSLTWQEDGKTIEDRVKLYCDYAHEVLKTDKNISDLRDKSNEDIVEYIYNLVIEDYNKKLEDVPPVVQNDFEKSISLKVIDKNWMNQLDAMEALKEGVGLRGYAQSNPLQVYALEGFQMFDNMLATISEEISNFLLNAEVRQNTEREEIKNIKTNDGKETVKRKPKKTVDKIGRNDSCPCGSGKKYKQCCGK